MEGFVMPSLFDDIDPRNSSLRDDDLNEDKLNSALDDRDEDARRERDLPEVEREELDKGLQAVRDEALKYIDARDDNGGKGRADSQGALIGAMSKK